MEPIPFALDGYLAGDPVPGDSAGTAVWRLISSPTDHLSEEAVLPCTTSIPDVADTVLTECEPGYLLRVVGHLALPDTADGVLRLHADTVEILWEPPQLDDPEETSTDATETVDTDADRNRAIQALAEALTGLGYQAAPDPQASVRIHIGPVAARGLDMDHCHTIDVTPAKAHKLADAVDALNCQLDDQADQAAGTVLDAETIADLTDVFGDIDLIGLTNSVLNATRPDQRRAVTQAMDDMFGDIPVPGAEDTDS
ncbi:hypothetical protein [Streptomyces sp. NPDC057413]|uniref:hypothetical protein n=1 Tax=Streptomyces sp. NPDC057413 TaxID=3346124 RepID=UPI0036C8B1CF